MWLSKFAAPQTIYFEQQKQAYAIPFSILKRLSTVLNIYTAL